MSTPEETIAAQEKVIAVLRQQLTQKEAQLQATERERLDYEEALDNVRVALGLEATHYLVIGMEVEAVVRQRDEAQAQVLTLTAKP